MFFRVFTPLFLIAGTSNLAEGFSRLPPTLAGVSGDSHNSKRRNNLFALDLPAAMEISTNGDLVADARASFSAAASTSAPCAGPALMVTGILDANGGGSFGLKSFELYARCDIADLSEYTVRSAKSGGSAHSFVPTGSAVAAGTFLYVTHSQGSHTAYFGEPADFEEGLVALNNDDAVEVLRGGAVEDVFGVGGVNGNEEDWAYQDGWAYRKNGRAPSATFDSADWTFTGKDALITDSIDGALADSVNPWPIGTYQP